MPPKKLRWSRGVSWRRAILAKAVGVLVGIDVAVEIMVVERLLVLVVVVADAIVAGGL